jgi:predicted molibdopterin-dependent oxidoreductase YjgC
MVVRVHTSPAAVKARRANIEFLLTNHPLDCPVCDKGGECPLQDQALLDGPGESRYIEERRKKNKRYPLGELIVLDQERCVLCWRCIRFLDEWADDHELDLFGRGADTRIDTFPGRPLTSKWQGNTIDICPVGALTSRIFRFEARVWELTNTPSVCPLCSVGCNVDLGVKNNRLRRITPRENGQVNDAWLCDKGRFAHGYVDHPDRLTVPLVRRDGELQPATWDEALGVVAQRLGTIMREHGPQSVAGLGSTRTTVEANYLFQRFLRTVVGTNSIDHLGRMPDGVFPLSSLPDLEHKDLFLLLGCDPSSEAPLVELWIKKAVLRHGARVVAANPRRIELARYAGPWLGYRPGTEVGVVNGLARALLDAGFEAGRGQATRATNLEEYRSWLRSYGGREVERLAGVSAEGLEQAARMLAEAERPMILIGPRWVQGAAAAGDALDPGSASPGLDVVANLALLLGDVDAGFVPEDGNTLGALAMGVAPDRYPDGQPFGDNKVRSRLASFWGGRLSPVEGLGFDGMMSAAREGTLQAMWIMGSDPASDCAQAGEALGRIPFLLVQDLFMTETASLADVVLPAASSAETDGSFINLTGRMQAVRAGKRPPGQAREDWRIIVDLARGMVDSKRQKAWDFAEPSDVLGEISRALPSFRGVTYAKMDEGGWQRPGPQRATRRMFVQAEPDLPAHDPDYPLLLVTGRLLYDRGTLLRHSEAAQGLAPGAHVVIHPSDAQALDLVDGCDVAVESAQGRLGFVVKISDEVVPGTVYAPLGLSAPPLSVLSSDRWVQPRVKVVK